MKTREHNTGSVRYHGANLAEEGGLNAPAAHGQPLGLLRLQTGAWGYACPRDRKAQSFPAAVLHSIFMNKS